MKVTVCFGSVRVVVPCGKDGSLLVRDLVNEATRRYRKAAGKESDAWVVIHHLQTQSGILDPDDRISDVADDREQIRAIFEDPGPEPGVQQGGGDGASGSSSVGTGSPDIFRDPTNTEAITGVDVTASTPHIEVTSTTSAPNLSVGLQVRRSSDPNLVQTLKNQTEATKRWSAAAPVCHTEPATMDRILDKVHYLSPQWEVEDDDVQTSPNSSMSFARSQRLSMQFLGDGNGYKWIDAAERVASQGFTSKSLPRETSKRKEPLGQAYESIREKDGEMLLIINEHGSPLGLTAIPDRELGGLIVQHVEPGSRAERGRLRKGDRILEINGTKLAGQNELNVQETLKRNLAASELRIRVLRANSGRQKKDTKIAHMIEAEEKSSGTKVATVSPTRKLPGAQAVTSLQVANTRKIGRKIEIVLKKGPHGLGFSVTTRDNPAGGQCPIYIKTILPRGAAIENGGLRTGDRLLEVDGIPMTGKSQSEVVQILRSTPSDAKVRIVISRQEELAEEDEREVNFTEEPENLANTPPKPPAPVLPANRTAAANSRSNRKEENIFQNNLRDQHFIDGGSESAASSDSLQAGIAWRNREVLTLHIPVHDTEKAGLGVSVKGKTGSANSSDGSNNSLKHDGDLGIFVKSVIHGGAASRDGRLRMNDQLLSVNGISLLGQNNAEAMETLRRAMMHTSGKHPGVITLSVARKISRSHSTGDILDANDSSNTSENSGATVIYLSPEKFENKENVNRWSNPVLDRLTGGVWSSGAVNKRPSPLMSQGLRNESYYIATNDNWSPAITQQTHPNLVNSSVLIEDDPEPLSPVSTNRPNDSVLTQHSTVLIQNPDATYDSQLSLDTSTSAEAFSRDAIGRRSISEKHHAALDARETGTYQRNKKIREDREKERRQQLTKSAYLSSSIESLTRMTGSSTRSATKSGGGRAMDLTSEALDQVGDLGPSLGMKKSSSLESLQTMVQEIQREDEPRGHIALRAPRGRGRDDSLRAAVVGGIDTNKPRKHWLLEEDSDGGFVNRNAPLQSSLNDGKNKNRTKKPGLLKGIGHMFRFGKHRKDVVMPTTETISEFGVAVPQSRISMQHQIKLGGNLRDHETSDRPKGGPPHYQPPPPPGATGKNGGHLHNDIFNHRYQQYVNYDELQHQISNPECEKLSESTLENMRLQVMRQRSKVEEESRRHQHYHSQRSVRSQQEVSHHHYQQSHPNSRPISSYYEYETVGNVAAAANRKISMPSPPRQWKAATLGGTTNQTNLIGGNGSGRHRGPFVTQVTIRDGGGGHMVPSVNSQIQQQQQQQHPHVYHHQQNGQKPHASKV